jgi:hypothetical protein
MTKAQHFQAELVADEDSTATSIRIPFNVQEVFNTHARLRVRGTINEFPFRGSIFPYGGIYYLGVTRAMRESMGIQAGDVVAVVMEPDLEPRVITPPPDFAAALAANPAAQSAWERLSYTHRREHVQAVEAARQPATRARRIARVVADLAADKEPR